MAQKTISSPFKVTIDGESLVVAIDTSLRDCPWGAHFGALQLALRKRMWEGRAFKDVLYDFKTCIWADPLPLMYLLIAAFEFTDIGGGIRIIIPDTTDTSARFLKFLSAEGFLQLFSTVSKGNIRSENLVIDQNKIEQYKEIGVPLAYVNSTLIPVHIAKFYSHEEVREWVEKQIDLLSSTVVDRVPGWALEDVLYRLKTFLFETLANIVDHAYLDHEMGYASIYVRFRKGIVGASAEERKTLRATLSRESDPNVCPRLTKDFLEGKEGCLEARVADSGIGLSKSLSSILANRKGRVPRYPFRYACELVFLKGTRRADAKKLTQYGGLHLLNRLLGENGDFIRGYDDDYWVGTKLPVQRVTAATSQGALGKDHCGAPIMGLAWTSRISWLSPTDREELGTWKKWNGEVAESPFLKELKSHDIEQGKFMQVYIDDRRFALSLGPNSRASKTIQSEYILLPNSGLSKNDIFKIVEDIAAASVSKNKINLIIGEIPSHEATTYSTALDGYRADKRIKWPSVFSKITLISQQFAVCVLGYSNLDNGFQQSNEKSDSFLTSVPNSGCYPSASLRHYIQILRYHDSQIFWRYLLSKHHDDDTYVSGSVSWTETLNIEGYLDFAKTLTDDFFRQFYASLLQRLPSLTPSAKCRLIPIDSNVRNLVIRYNSSILPRLRGTSEAQICIGSVQVTGLTQTLSVTNDSLTAPITVHFFRHPNATLETPHLLLWPKLDVLIQNIPKKNDYSRVGMTFPPKTVTPPFRVLRYNKTKEEGSSWHTRSTPRNRSSPCSGRERPELK